MSFGELLSRETEVRKMGVIVRLHVLMTLVVGALSGDGISVPTELSAEEIKALLQRHNEMRRQTVPSGANIRMLSWDDRLAGRAQAYSNECKFAHSAKSILEPYGALGENIYITDQAKLGVEDIARSVNAWFNEYHDYDFTTNVCAPSKMCGHYTQTVWDNTYKVGCGKRKCRKKVKVGTRTYQQSTLVICKYGPSGNVRPLFSPKARRPFKKGDRCSACPDEAPVCVDGLCYVRKPLDKATTFETLTTTTVVQNKQPFTTTMTTTTTTATFPWETTSDKAVSSEITLQPTVKHSVLRCYTCDGRSTAKECTKLNRTVLCSLAAARTNSALNSSETGWSCARYAEENMVKMKCIETEKCKQRGKGRLTNLTCCDKDLCNNSKKAQCSFSAVILTTILTGLVSLT